MALVRLAAGATLPRSGSSVDRGRSKRPPSALDVQWMPLRSRAPAPLRLQRFVDPSTFLSCLREQDPLRGFVGSGLAFRAATVAGRQTMADPVQEAYQRVRRARLASRSGIVRSPPARWCCFVARSTRESRPRIRAAVGLPPVASWCSGCARDRLSRNQCALPARRCMRRRAFSPDR